MLLHGLHEVHGLHGSCIARQVRDGPGHVFEYFGLVCQVD